MSETTTNLAEFAPRRRPPPVEPPQPFGGQASAAVRLGRIVRHEWRSLAADGTLRLIALLFAVLIGYALYNDAAWTRFQEQTLDAVAAEEAARLEALRLQVERITAAIEEAPSSFRDPRRPAVVGGNLGRRHALLPPAPLAAVSVGQGDLQPYYVPISTRSREVLLANDEIENPLHLLAGRFDLAFVIVFLFPLLILALSYNLLSQEKEQGTLALVLSQPVALGRMVAGKVLARLALVLGLAMGLSVLGLLLAGASPTAPGVWSRFALLVAVVALYGAFWFALAVAVNALGRSSAANAVALAALWLLLVILVPSALNVAASTLYPVPSRVEMISAMREAARQAQQEGSTRLARYYEEHPELAPEGEADLADFATLAYAAQERVEAEIQPVRGHFAGQLTRQQEVISRFRFLSPAILTQQALNDVAGTGEARYRRFLDQVDAFHTEWRAYFGPRIYRQEPLAAADFAAFPAWSFREETIGAVAGQVGGSATGLLVATALVGVLAAGALRRFPRAG